MEFKELFKLRNLVSEITYILEDCIQDDDFFEEEIYYESVKKNVLEKIEQLKKLDFEIEITKNLYETDIVKKEKYEEHLNHIFKSLDDELRKPFDLLDDDDCEEDYFNNENLRFKQEFEKRFIDDEKRKFVVETYDFIGNILEQISLILILDYYEYGKTKKQIVNEVISKNEKITKKERFVYLKEAGFFELHIFKKTSQNNREKLLSKILDCNIDYARDLIINNINKYSKDEKNGIKDEMIEKVKNDINELRK